MAGLQQRVYGFRQRRLYIQSQHIGARHHNLTRQRIAQRKNRINHLSLTLLEDAFLLPGIHQRFELVFSNYTGYLERGFAILLRALLETEKSPELP